MLPIFRSTWQMVMYVLGVLITVLILCTWM